jgi:hypothetical protein
MGGSHPVVDPPFSEWSSTANRNRALAERWTCELAGRPIAAIRRQAREEFLSAARSLTERIGIPAPQSESAQGLVIATGHQPELYHPGIWAKDLLIQRFRRENGGYAVDVVVDSDAFGRLEVSAPSISPVPRRLTCVLASGTPGACYAGSPLPDESQVEQFIRAVTSALNTLQHDAPARSFSRFAEALLSSRQDARDIAELITIARRRYEGPEYGGYLEVMIARLARTVGYLHLIAEVIVRAREFAHIHNEVLAQYRRRAKTRSAAQPFPDLAVDDAGIELPIWHLEGGRRRRVRVVDSVDGFVIESGAGPLITVPAQGEGAVAALAASDIILAPGALLLTMAIRLLWCDLFVHGLGGARYDRVTDGVIERFCGIIPPDFATVSLSASLVDEPAPSAHDIAQAKERLNRFDHNPDDFVGDIRFESTTQEDVVRSLLARKAGLVREIAGEGADKKALSVSIRAVNAALATELGPVRMGLESELAVLTASAERAAILTDRTYPFCYWDPRRIEAMLF